MGGMLLHVGVFLFAKARRAQLKAAEAKILADKAELEHAQTEYDRYADLAKKAAASAGWVSAAATAAGVVHRYGDGDALRNVVQGDGDGNRQPDQRIGQHRHEGGQVRSLQGAQPWCRRNGLSGSRRSVRDLDSRRLKA